MTQSKRVAQKKKIGVKKGGKKEKKKRKMVGEAKIELINFLPEP